VHARVVKPSTPAPPPEDLTPGPQASLPGIAGWSDRDADLARGPRAVFSTNPPGVAAGDLPSIGHIARYDLKYRIGEGGLATVYAAHDPVLSRLVAIKTVHVEVPPAERESFSALFMNEARAAAALSHPNIVTVFDAGLADRGAYIAMELLKGVDLRRLRDEGWRPTPGQAAQLAANVADALAYAHAHGVVHRDIKPANIFMVGRTQPRVLDFGIARLTHRLDSAAEAEVCGGSPYYMAPEQILQQPTDARCDVFSLGVVLYELLTGVRPFEGSDLARIQRAVLEHVPPPADTITAGVPASLGRIATRAMAKYPDGRYPSAAAMARALRQFQDERADDGQTPSVRQASLPACAPHRRRRLAFVLGAALLLVLIAAWLYWSQREASTATTAAVAAMAARA
jgi:serine/threonine-protein kinase